MANPEHLKILEQGVEAWNEWREEEPATEPDLRFANLFEDCLEGANLSCANLRGATLLCANLGRADLRRADLQQANVHSANLTEASLEGTNLRGADLGNASLNGANLGGAILERANLRNANLCGANLECAFIRLSSLSGADLRMAKLGGAFLLRTDLGDIDLSDVDNLTAVQHEGPSTIGTDTLLRTAQGLSGDRSHQGEVESFLRGAGVEEQFIDFFRNMIGQPIEFYSCFISYSHKDKSFAQRLEQRLKQRTIRCWRDDKVLPGDRIIPTVTKAIRGNEKMLLCCSEASLQSSFVEDEIAAAVKTERQEGRDIIIPLMLDGSFLSWQGDHSVRIQERLAADFTGWEEDNAKFEGEFENVVQALRPKSKESGDG